jgi:hypothetical protein
MPANVINFVNELIYGDLGAAELGALAPPLPAGALNHLRWTLDKKPSSGGSTVTGQEFLTHHLDYMLARYEAWISKYFLPPVRPWDGQDMYPGMGAPEGPTMPATLNGSPFPGGWTENNLGTAVRNYYNDMRHYFNGTEMNQDEIKAPYSYRYFAFMKWASDLRKRLLGIPVLPVSIVYDKDGTVLTSKDFTDIFYQVHHIWHPNGAIGSGWTAATPYFRTSVGQHIGKKEISRTQVGAEFFLFHHDHLELFDRWLARTGQEPIESHNTCAHDTAGGGSPPLGVEADSSGNPKVDWSSSATNPTVDFNPVHATQWNGDLHEFVNLGLMGQLFATDNNQFGLMSVSGWSDFGYHGEGHVLNGDLIDAVTNNHVPRFFAWHGHIDEVWQKRRPDFNALDFALTTNAPMPSPQVLTIVRDLNSSTDTVEPNNLIAGIDRATGEGTLKIKLNVRTDPFNRPLELKLRCDVLRESVSSVPVISITRDLVMTTAAPANPNERQQNVDFFEDFVFDGSAGTVDASGEGPFVADNLLFMPTDTGFKNSTIRITGYLVCKQQADGTTAAVSGTISSTGTTVTGSGTSFTTELKQGDLLRANDQVRPIATIVNNTSLTLIDPFDANLPAGTPYERLDGFDYLKVIELPLIQEKQPPEITTYLNLSSFSKDQVDSVASGGQSVFDNSFYVILQDRTSRAANIVWPPEVEPQLQNLIAPPVYNAGLYTDAAHQPLVELKDLSDNPVPNIAVDITSIAPESPGLHPAFTQRVTYTCRVTFTGNTAFAGMAAGDTTDLKLVVTATDRAGNVIVDDTKRIRLQVNANPYMLDGPTSWLSVDTRVFKIIEGQARFGVAAGWTNPHTFIQQVIANFRTGNGTAGGETFDSLVQDQAGSVLEYSTQVNGDTYHNFALAKMHLESVTGANNVRASFRLFRWGTANVEFDDSLAYRTAPSGIALLGKTSSNELASIPFFAEPRVSVSTPMDTQTDPTNLLPTFGPGNVQSFFGAYLDINQSANRFPDTYTGDGGFSGTLFSIRNLLLGNHQCMIVEIIYTPDPTAPGATPGTSDNLSQRNLLIVQTANPGSEITRTVQHLFDIDLTRKRRRQRCDGKNCDHKDHDDEHKDNGGDGHDHGHETETHEHMVFVENNHLSPVANLSEPLKVLPARTKPFGSVMGHHGKMNHLSDGWIAQFPEILKEKLKRVHEAEAIERQWQFDPVEWKPGKGLDELIFFWNNLPKNSVVDVFIPGAPVTEIFNYRNLRHAPGTVKIVDENTLRLTVGDVTYLPIPPFYGDNLAGLITVQLPAGIKKGQRYTVDVLQVRADETTVLGGFQLHIQVEKAFEIVEAERRTLELFHRRLSLTRKDSRWLPVLQKQVEFTRKRAEGLVGLANEELSSDTPFEWSDPTENQKGQRLKVVLEKIQILDDREPFFKGKGEFRFYSKVYSPDNNGVVQKNVFPKKGYFTLGEADGENEIELKSVIFDDYVENALSIQIGGLELDTFDPDDLLCTYKRLFQGKPEDWIGEYAAHDGEMNTENLGGWKVWYRVEYSG